MARIITKELALKIVKKLQARLIKSKSKAHDEYSVEHEGVFIAIISVRRSSDMDIGHDHIQKDLHISTSQAKRLGQCPWKRKDFLKCMREKGHLPSEEEGQEDKED